VPATIVVALVALIVLVGWTVLPDRSPAIEGAIRPAATEPGLRLLPDQIDCPDAGRGEGPASVAWPQIDDRSAPTTNRVRGQAVPLEILLSAPTAGQDRVGFEVDLTEARDRGPAGFDPDLDVICAFVDTSDPMTDDAGTLASVDVDPVRGAAGSLFTVEGLDPGDEVVVEAWAAITSSGAARAGSPTATLRSRSIPGGGRLDASEPLARVPVEFGTGGVADAQAVAVSIDDGGVGATPGASLPYEIVVTNTQAVDAINGIHVIAVPSELTAVDSVDITGEGSGATACEVESTDGRIRCSATHLAPGESVTIGIATTVADRSTPQWLREEGTCTPDDSDVCMRVELTWEGSGGNVESLSVSDPAAVLGDDRSIALAKYELPDEATAPTIEYSVISATTTPLADVSVRDHGCEPVTFVDGDPDGDQLLDTGEEWRYRCTGSVDGAGTSPAVVNASRDGVSVGDVAVSTP